MYDLSKAIETNLAGVYISCLSHEVITQGTYSNLEILGLSNIDKATKLVGDIYKQLQSNKDNQHHYLLKVFQAFEKEEFAELTKVVENMKLKLLL